MQVPAAGVIALERRPAHEGGEISHSAADLPRRRAEQQRMVGGLQRRPRGERALELARSPLVLDRAQRQSDLSKCIGERGEHRLHQIHVGFGVVGKAGLGRRRFDRLPAHAGKADIVVAERVLRDAQQIPLDLQPDEQAHALVRRAA